MVYAGPLGWERSEMEFDHPHKIGAVIGSTASPGLRGSRRCRAVTWGFVRGLTRGDGGVVAVGG